MKTRTTNQWRIKQYLLADLTISMASTRDADSIERASVIVCPREKSLARTVLRLLRCNKHILLSATWLGTLQHSLARTARDFCWPLRESKSSVAYFASSTSAEVSPLGWLTLDHALHHCHACRQMGHSIQFRFLNMVIHPKPINLFSIQTDRLHTFLHS